MRVLLLQQARTALLVHSQHNFSKIDVVQLNTDMKQIVTIGIGVYKLEPHVTVLAVIQEKFEELAVVSD